MKKYHVACGQFEAIPGDKQRNLGKISEQVHIAADRSCDLIVFPEMSLTGYLPPDELAPLAESVEGESLAAVRATARDLSISVSIGFPELDADTGLKSNTFVVFDRHGSLVFVYRKVHLWDTEAAWAEPGKEIHTVQIDGVVLSGWICYDTRFPELARLCFLKGAELCLVPTAWLGPPAEWELSLRARALDNTFFVAGADLINNLPGLICRGLSMIVDPRGEVLARAEPGVECVIDAVLDPSIMEAQSTRVRLGKDRKPGLYKALTE